MQKIYTNVNYSRKFFISFIILHNRRIKFWYRYVRFLIGFLSL